MMGFVYLVLLLGGIASMLLIDRRFELFFWRDPAVALLVTVVGTALFLWWDVAGIANGIFFQGDSQVVSGIELAHELPLEEPVFLIFLSVCTMVLFTGTMRLLDYRTRRSGGAKS